MSTPQHTPPPATRARVAYLMSRFPKLTETFVLCEILAVERQGTPVEIYPLLRERARIVHPEAEPLVARAHYKPFLSWPIVRANLYYLRRRPRRYLSALGVLLRSTWGSLRFLVGGMGIFPKAVCFARELEQKGITHVHAHFASHPAATAFVIQRLTGIPYSFTAHGSDLHRDRHMLREKVEEADFVVAVSEYNRRVIVRECGEHSAEKVVVIHCGVDTELFQPTGARSASGKPFTILCTGTLHEVKGQAYLIDACQKLAERGVDFVCQLIGDGEDRAALERRAAEAGLSGRVKFLGSRTRSEVAELLQQADVLAAPSVPTANGRREGIPVALMEAAASGLPIVASGISGIPELVEDGLLGYLVPPRDVTALADALERLAQQPRLRQELGLEGRKKALREFDLDVNARELARRFRAEPRS